MDKETLSTLGGYIADKVNEGFDTRDEIVDSAVEYALDEPRPDLHIVVEQMVGVAIRQRLAEQSAWSEPTDCDRLDGAFEALCDQGVVARQNFTCCSTCGHSEIWMEVAEARDDGPVVGYAFYHSQDTDRAREGGSIFIKFGRVDDEDGRALTTEEVGQRIVDALSAAGLDASWSGDPDEAVQVALRDWRRRLPTH